MRTPYFEIDAEKLESNLKTLKGVMDRTGCKILLAQKCFSCYGLYPLVQKYLAGATASGLYEARLCHEEMAGAENHVFSPAYREEDFLQLIEICDHIVFNSPRQLAMYGQRAKNAGLQVGLRINPECSTQEGHAIYDPCSPGSRLGTRLGDWVLGDRCWVLADSSDASDELHCETNSQHLTPNPQHPTANSQHPTPNTQHPTPNTQHPIELLDGLHFHTLCEQNSDDLETTLDAVEEKFGAYLRGDSGHKLKWINFGGGHHITREDYDIERLERCIRRMQERYGLQVYLEPGEAVALNAGTLHATVLEVQPEGADGIRNVILDTSAACHMPDVIEMPYTPPIDHIVTRNVPDDAHPTEYRYRFGGPTCLSGDVIGEFTFDRPLVEGDEIVFGDMAIYSMVKTNTFNGMPLPDIYIKDATGSRLWKHFGYDEFKRRV